MSDLKELQLKFLSSRKRPGATIVRSLRSKLCSFTNKRSGQKSVMLIAFVQESTTNTLTKLVAFENLDVFVGTNFLSLFEISGFARQSEDKILLQRFSQCLPSMSEVEFPKLREYRLSDMAGWADTICGVTERCFIQEVRPYAKAEVVLTCDNCGDNVDESLGCNMCSCQMIVPNFGIQVLLSNGTDGLTKAYTKLNTIRHMVCDETDRWTRFCLEDNDANPERICHAISVELRSTYMRALFTYDRKANGATLFSLESLLPPEAEELMEDLDDNVTTTTVRTPLKKKQRS